MCGFVSVLGYELQVSSTLDGSSVHPSVIMTAVAIPEQKQVPALTAARNRTQCGMLCSGGIRISIGKMRGQRPLQMAASKSTRLSHVPESKQFFLPLIEQPVAPPIWPGR